MDFSSLFWLCSSQFWTVYRINRFQIGTKKIWIEIGCLRKESDIRMKLAKKHTKEIDGGWMKMICRVCKAHTLRHNHENWKYFVLFVIVVVALHLRLGFAFSSIDNALIEINGQWLNANVQTACHICWHTMYLFTHVSQR